VRRSATPFGGRGRSDEVAGNRRKNRQNGGCGFPGAEDDRDPLSAHERKNMERATYKPLPMMSMPAAVVCQPPVVGPKPVKTDMPAIDVMTDLRQVAAATIRADATLAQANRTMIARGVRCSW
jgi:hypothetical protein